MHIAYLSMILSNVFNHSFIIMVIPFHIAQPSPIHLFPLGGHIGCLCFSHVIPCDPPPQRIAGITSMLQQSLEDVLIEGLQTSNLDMVRHCLRTYATIDKTRDAEALVGQVLVKPYMDQVSQCLCTRTHKHTLCSNFYSLPSHWRDSPQIKYLFFTFFHN